MTPLFGIIGTRQRTKRGANRHCSHDNTSKTITLYGSVLDNIIRAARINMVM